MRTKVYLSVRVNQNYPKHYLAVVNNKPTRKLHNTASAAEAYHDRVAARLARLRQANSIQHSFEAQANSGTAG